MSDQLCNPIQTRGAYYAPHTTASPPGFKKLSTPLFGKAFGHGQSISYVTAAQQFSLKMYNLSIRDLKKNLTIYVKSYQDKNEAEAVEKKLTRRQSLNKVKTKV